jgi:hypothetical protein
MTAVTGLSILSTTDFSWPAGMPAFDNEQMAGFVRWQLGQSPKLYAPSLNLQILFFSILPCAGIVTAVWRQMGPRAALIVMAGIFVTWSIVFVGVDTDRFFEWGSLTAIILATAADGRISGRAPGDLHVAPGQSRI